MSTDQTAASKTASRMNWGGNYAFQAATLHEPGTVDEVREIVARAAKVKALGSAHSFNSIADTDGTQVSLARLKSMELNVAEKTVTVGSGIIYAQLAPYLHERGFAVHNLASLPHISVVGACLTATHGSGSGNGCLSTAVSGFEFVAADGSLQTLSRAKDGELFAGAVVNLGGLGIITSVTLEVQPAFEVAQSVYEGLALSQLEKHLEEIFLSGYSVSLFTDWQEQRIRQVWVKRRVESGVPPVFAPELFGATLATKTLHPLPNGSTENRTVQLGIPGPSFERLPHFRPDLTPSNGEELQTEYFVPLDRGYEAIMAVEELRDRITPHLFISELRTVAADDLWMSMAYRRPSLALHFTWKRNWEGVREVLPLIEAKLAPFAARPHWAKLFTVPPAQVQQLYPRMYDFKALLAKYDPQGKFRNAFLDTNVFDL
ncbi:D-arabinono-1,4-lactone oxidase [Granulicella tundricola]|nr:D-arabinono-1,4-lactone oxidase [Granulicella tundricola]